MATTERGPPNVTESNDFLNGGLRSLAELGQAVATARCGPHAGVVLALSYDRVGAGTGLLGQSPATRFGYHLVLNARRSNWIPHARYILARL